MRLRATGNFLELVKTERMTSGSVNWNEAAFEFNADWDGMARTAVFRTQYGKTKLVLLGASNSCKIPFDVLECRTSGLYISVFGVRGDRVVITTNYVSTGAVEHGADRWAVEGEELNLTVYEQILAVLQSGMDHRSLTGRDARNQHPLWAVVGLEEALATIPTPMTAEELRTILTNGGTINGR